MGTAYVMEIMCMRAYIGELLVCKQTLRHEEGPYMEGRSPGLIVHGKFFLLIKIKKEKVPHGRESRIIAHGVISLCADRRGA